MPYCTSKNCSRDIAKMARYGDFNAFHGKRVVRCGAGHATWPPSPDAPTGHAGPYAEVAWQDVPERWLRIQVVDYNPENKLAIRCRAELQRRWEERHGCAYADFAARKDA